MKGSLKYQACDDKNLLQPRVDSAVLDTDAQSARFRTAGPSAVMLVVDAPERFCRNARSKIPVGRRVMPERRQEGIKAQKPERL